MRQGDLENGGMGEWENGRQGEKRRAKCGELSANFGGRAKSRPTDTGAKACPPQRSGGGTKSQRPKAKDHTGLAC